jgi:UDP-3-O-[3-hydroxymyristoyl] N-acetylglucosamine deacetylase
MGDMSLLGRPVIGHLKVVKSGHALNHKLLQRLLSDPSAYSIVRARTRELERLNLRLPDLAGSLEPAVA